MIKVGISRTQHQVVLNNQCGDPHIVGWDWRSLLTQLTKDGSVVVRSLFVLRKDRDTRLH
jgi:hypothetical protein